MNRQERHFYSRSAAACLRRTLPSLLPLLLLLCFVGGLHADDTTRDVQEELRKRNLYFGDVDGRRTPQLIAALRRYQDHKGFSPTGEMDEETLRSLSLRPAQPLGFAPPAAAATVSTVSNMNPGSAGDAAGSGNSLVSQQDITVPYWPDTPVLRSDQGRGTPPGAALSTALNNLVPGAADQISLPARFTTVPPSSFSPGQGPAAADVRDFIMRYLRAGQSNAPDAEMAFYGAQVNYFNEGTVDRRFIVQDIRRYETRWPQRAFTLIGPISVVADANNFDHTLVRFRYRFTLKNNHVTANGIATTLYTLEGNSPDSLRIISLSENRERNAH